MHKKAKINDRDNSTIKPFSRRILTCAMAKKFESINVFLDKLKAYIYNDHEINFLKLKNKLGAMLNLFTYHLIFIVVESFVAL